MPPHTKSICLLAIALVSSAQAHAQELTSWNDSDTQKAITQFVERVTTKGSSDFIPVEKRIAVFDNDGTLWSEKPFYFQLVFALDRIKEMAPDHPEWNDDPTLKAAIAGDMKVVMSGGEHALLKIVMTTHAGMTTEEFEAVVQKWITTARHPETKMLYSEMVYQPMLELLAYLRKHQFQTWIVSGGGVEFMRPWAERVYGIPPEQVVGSSIKVKYEVRNGTPVLVRLPEVDEIDDKEGKPACIQKYIGRQPVMAFGNSDGDFQMLEWTTSGNRPSLGILIHHTDAVREYAYDRESSVGRLVRGLDEAKQRGWVIVDMKRDWTTIYPATTPLRK